MHRYDEAVEWIKSQNDLMEAREWLDLAGMHYGVIHEMSHEESVEAVEECYDRGAERVDVLGILPKDVSGSSADMLLVTLPGDPIKRRQLFKLEETIADMSGCQLSVDEGQHYMLLRWA